MRRTLSTRLLVLLVLALLVAGGPVAALGLDGPAPAASSAQRAAEAADGPPRDAPLVPNAMNPAEVLKDPEGDVEFQYFGENPAPPSDQDAPVDILTLGLAETDRELVFSLKHRAYPEAQGTLASAWILNAYCDIRFRLNGDANHTYGIALDYLLPLDGGYDAWAYVYRAEPEDEPGGYYDRDYVEGVWTALVSNDHFEMVVPKPLFEMDGGPGLRTGDRLTDFALQCTRDSGALLLRYLDTVAEDPKARYTISMAPSTAEIGLSLPEDASHSAAVPVGKTTKVSVSVQNFLQRKLLVNLSAEVVGSDGKPLKGWSVTSAPTLEMKTNGTMPASLIVSVDESVQHRDGGILKVQAFPLGFEAKATFTFPVYATVPLGPDKNTLQFHRAEGWSFYCGGICIGGSGTFDAVSDPTPDAFVMNVLENDPLYGQDPGEDDGVAILSTDYAYAYLDAPLGSPIRFDPDGFLEFTVSLKTEVAREVDFEASIWATDDQFLGRVDQRLALTENFQSFTFTMPVNEEALNLPRGAFFGMGMRFTEATMFDFSGNTWVSSVEWDPAQTSLRLPLVAIPQPEVNVTDGRALPSILLGNNTDKEEYVNPGATQAFDLVLLNEGTDKDMLRLTAKTSMPGWKVEFEPGNRFELAAGGSAPLCMTVIAPEDVVEGDQVNVTLTATSKLDEKVKTQIDLVLLVTNHPIDPRTCTEISEEDFVKPVSEEEESPGVAPFLVLSVLGLLVAALRRRL